MRALLKYSLSALYGLVMIEFVVMISPFAFYWYSLYTPTLQGLHTWKATAWLEAFFLPHSIITTSPILEFLRWQVGTYAFSAGMIGFFICAAQVYGSKRRRQGVVHSWIYSRVRHPQYLCLAVAGFGLLTMWPRIIILVLYVGMLFSYYFLAIVEEKQMAATHADYAAYRRRTAMFLPGEPGGKLFRILFGWIPHRSTAVVVSSTVVAVVVIGSSLFLRHYTIDHAAMEFMTADRTLAIAVWPMSHDTIEQIVSAAIHDARVRSALDKEAGAVFAAHILPADYGMVDMFADGSADHSMCVHLSLRSFRHLGGLALPFLRRHHRDRVMGTPQDQYQVVFSRVDGPDHRPVPVSGVTGLAAKMTPVVIADVAVGQPTLENVVIPPRRSLWGDITMPMF